MYKCCKCDAIFDEPETLATTYEAYYGVGGEIGGRHSLFLSICPECRYEEIEEIECEEE